MILLILKAMNLCQTLLSFVRVKNHSGVYRNRTN